MRRAVYEFDPTGETIIATLTEAEPGKPLGEPVAVAVDGETGGLCVVDAGSRTVYCFNAFGALVTTITGPESGVAFKLPTGVALDSKTGEIWVADPGKVSVYGFSASGTHEATLGSPFVEPFSVALNSVTGEVYVGDGSTKAVYGFNALGALVSEWKEPSPGVSFGEPAGVAVDSSTGDVYVADFRNKVAYGLSASGTLVSTVAGVAEEPFQSPLAVGLDSSTGTVYVGDRGTHKVYVFGALVTVPDVVTGVASEVREGSATVGGTVNPDEVPVNSCEFEYGSSTAYGELAPCKQNPGAGGAPVEVSAVLKGLRGGVTYHYRLVAGNANGVTEGADETLFLASPAIESTSTSDLTRSSVELGAVINPDGSNTAYHFEYGPTAAYGTSVPIPDESIGSGTTPQTVAQRVSNLHAGATYHFRVVAQNEDGVEVGSDHTFIYASASGGLPDSREYEVVTPLEKAGSVVAGLHFTIASDGSSLLGYSEAAFAGLTNGELAPSAPAFYRFERTGSGWVTSPATCCALEAVSFGPDGLVWHPAEQGTGVDHLFFGEAAKGGSDVEAAKGMSDVGPVWPPELGVQPAAGIQYSVVGAASNPANGILFTIREQALLWPFDHTAVATPASSLYKYTGANNSRPTLVGVTGGTGSTTLVSECGTSLGAPAVVGKEGSRYNAISEDGRRVFFTAEAGPGHAPPYLVSTCENEGRAGTAPPADELYARCSPGACLAPNGGEEETVWVSEPTCARSSPRCRNVNTEAYSAETASAAGVLFEGASADGSRVFFTTTQQLTSSDTDTTRDLYEYDLDAPAGQRLTLISAGGTGDATPGSGAEVQGMSRISEDGSHVYFVANGVLTTVANSEGQVAQAGADNMYVYEPDPAHPGQNATVFIAELCSGPGISGSVGDPECPAGLNSERWFEGGVNDQGMWSHGLEGGDERPVQATPDGQVLVFTSYGDLTKDDHSVARQVFEYEAGTGTLKRISIGAEGFNDDGNVGGVGSADARIVTPLYGEGGAARGGGLARTMSDDGSFVFFESPVGLTPGALDRVRIDARGDLADNVYEYHDGVVSLISDGRDTSVLSGASGHSQRSAVALIGTDPTGADVFFTTADSLVPQDEDTQEDIYDARVGGGFPLGKRQVFCESSCQPPAGPPPATSAPSSGSFFGPGNSSSTVDLIPRRATRAQRLAAALKACRKKSRRRRVACEARARKSFASKARAKRARGAAKGSRRGK